MMHGMQKSDTGVVAMKSMNKGADNPAESVERRTVPEGNPGGQSTRQTQDWESVSQAAERVRQFVQREPGKRLTTLLHHVTADAVGRKNSIRRCDLTLSPRSYLLRLGFFFPIDSREI